MTLPKYALTYNSCKIDELRRFFKDRTGKDPDMHSGKRVLVSALKKLDDNATFRFLDLPAEMRNKVYRSLVIYNVDAERKVYPAILRTSKEIYQEAKYILMTESMIPLSTDFEKKWKGVYRRNFFTMQGYRSDLSAFCQGAVNFRFADALGDFAPFFAAQFQPLALARVQSIHLRLHLGQAGRPFALMSSLRESDQWSGELATSFLHTLISTCRHLKHLKLSITTDHNGHDAAEVQQALVRMLRPVGELPSAKMTLDLQGLPDATYDEFWRIANSSSA